MTCLKELALPEMLNFLPEPFWLTLLSCNATDAADDDNYNDDDDDDDNVHQCAFQR